MSTKKAAKSSKQSSEPKKDHEAERKKPSANEEKRYKERFNFAKYPIDKDDEETPAMDKTHKSRIS